MKNLVFTILILVSIVSSTFGQYPSWFPEEFKNKIFCGQFESCCTGFNTVPFKLHSSEDGIFLEINPGEKFGRDEWGQTVKLKYAIEKTEISDIFPWRKTYTLKVSSSNETSDSPIHPKYTLKRISIIVDAYNGQKLTRDQERAAPSKWKSGISFEVGVPYYGSGYDFITIDQGCGTIKNKRQLLLEEKQRQERLAEEKRQQELLKQKRQEIIAAIELKIPNQILEASELFLKNKSTLMPLNETALKTLDKLEKGLIDHYANDTLKIALKPHPFEKYYISTLTAGSHVFSGDFNDAGKYFPFTIDYLAEMRKETKVKDICCDVYRPFRIDFMVEVRDSILIETNYYSSNTKKPVFMKNNLEFYYKASSNLTTLELEYNAAIPKGSIEVVKTYKYEKRLNDFIESESEYKVSYRKVILKKEK
jgi:hypothetical protein